MISKKLFMIWIWYFILYCINTRLF